MLRAHTSMDSPYLLYSSDTHRAEHVSSFLIRFGTAGLSVLYHYETGGVARRAIFPQDVRRYGSSSCPHS